MIPSEQQQQKNASEMIAHVLFRDSYQPTCWRQVTRMFFEFSKQQLSGEDVLWCIYYLLYISRFTSVPSNHFFRYNKLYGGKVFSEVSK